MSWECRLFLAMMYDGVCNLPFYLAICASVFGAFSISNRVQRLHIDTGVLESDLRIYGVRYWGQALLIWPMGLGCPRLPFGEVGYVEWLQAGYILCDMIVCDKIDWCMCGVCCNTDVARECLVVSEYVWISLSHAWRCKARGQLATCAHRRIPFRVVYGCMGSLDWIMSSARCKWGQSSRWRRPELANLCCRKSFIKYVLNDSRKRELDLAEKGAKASLHYVLCPRGSPICCWQPDLRETRYMRNFTNLHLDVITHRNLWVQNICKPSFLRHRRTCWVYVVIRMLITHQYSIMILPENTYSMSISGPNSIMILPQNAKWWFKSNNGREIPAQIGLMSYLCNGVTFLTESFSATLESVNSYQYKCIQLLYTQITSARAKT